PPRGLGPGGRNVGLHADQGGGRIVRGPGRHGCARREREGAPGHDARPPPPPWPPPPPAPPPPAEPKAGRQPVAVEMRNVDLHITDDITLRIEHLDGRFVGTSRSGIPYLDDPNTYEVVVDSAHIVMDMASLNALLNEHVLGHGRSNVEDLTVATDDKGRL